MKTVLLLALLVVFVPRCRPDVAPLECPSGCEPHKDFGFDHF